MMHGGMNSLFGIGPIWLILFWLALVVLGIYLLVNFVDGNKHPTKNKQDKKQNSSLNILQDRFAKGEITEAEYKHKKNILKKD